MDIYEVRRQNLQWLIDNEFDGVNANLARELGIQPSYLSRIFSQNAQHQRNIGARLARAIEEVAKRQRGWMDEPHLARGAATLEARKDGKAVVLTPFGDRMVPIVDTIQAWQWTASSKPYPLTDRTEVIWTRLSELSERAFAVIIEGESMADEFYPGDTVIIDPELPPKPGDFVVAKMEAESTVIFRKYRPRRAGAKSTSIIDLTPINDDYPTTVIDAENKGRIIGTMIEHRKYRRTERISSTETIVRNAKVPKPS